MINGRSNKKPWPSFHTRTATDPIIEIVNPLQISTEPWGVLRIIYTLKVLQDEIQRSRRRIRNEIKRMVVRSILTSLGFLGVCLVVVFILSSRVSRPLIRLTEAARKFSKGDFSLSSDILIGSRDEVGVLGASFFEDDQGSEKFLFQAGRIQQPIPRSCSNTRPYPCGKPIFSGVRQLFDLLRQKGDPGI